MSERVSTPETPMVERLDAVQRGAVDSPSATELRDLRHLAAEEIEAHGRPTWPPPYDDPFPELVGAIPEVTPAELDVAMLGGAVAHHGALLIRGLLGPDDTAGLRENIARSREGFDRYYAAEPADRSTDDWFAPFETGKPKDATLRQRVGEQGGIWLADSPATTRQVLSLLGSVGVVDAVAAHFAERPAFSLQKSTLRCIAPEERLTAWHQDGSFLSDDVRTMNVWIALTDCGGDQPASGLEIMPRRVDEILPTDAEFVRAAVPFPVVDELAINTPVAHPEFRAGDALMFDERFLHRTALGPGLTEPRYALECWFFAPSHTNETYVSFLA